MKYPKQKLAGESLIVDAYEKMSCCVLILMDHYQNQALFIRVSGSIHEIRKSISLIIYKGYSSGPNIKGTCGEEWETKEHTNR